MKAKNTKTGEVVTDFAFSKEFGTVTRSGGGQYCERIGEIVKNK